MNQRVGILTGIVLFIGSVMTGYYGNTNLWAWVTAVTFGFIVWTYARTWRESTLFDIAWAAFLLGALSAFTARLAGLIFSRITFGDFRPDPTTEYDIINGELLDVFRVILNGDLSQTIGLVAIIGLISAVVAVGSEWFGKTMKERA